MDNEQIKQSLRRSLHQAQSGQRIPLSQMWDDGMQWYDANTGEAIDMTAPDVVAFRSGDLIGARKLLWRSRLPKKYPG